MKNVVMKMFYVLALLLCLSLAANAADFTIENALDAFWRHVRAEGGEKQCDNGFGSDEEDESNDDEYTHDGFFPSKKKQKPSVEEVLSVDFDGDKRLWRVEHWSLLKIGNFVERDETSTSIFPVYTNLVVASAVDSSGKVVELSSRCVSDPPINGLPFKSLVSFCKAKGINLATVSGLRSGGSGSGTEAGVVRYGGTTLCVTKEDVMKAEKDAFLAAISNADRVVVRRGGYNCCKQDIDNESVVLSITNAADIAAFNRMFQLKDKGNSGCLCCGFPGVDWWRDGKRVVLTGVQHGRAIRWCGFSFGDRLFTDEAARELEAWLSRHSLDESAAKRQDATAGRN